MKRTTARVTAAAVAAMMAMASLSGCGVMSSASKEVTTQSTTSTQQDSKEIHDLVPGTSGVDRNFHLQSAKFANKGRYPVSDQYVGWYGRGRQLWQHCSGHCDRLDD